MNINKFAFTEKPQNKITTKRIWHYQIMNPLID